MNEADREKANLQSEANHKLAYIHESIEKFYSRGGKFRKAIDEFYVKHEGSPIGWREMEQLIHKLYEMDERAL